MIVIVGDVTRTGQLYINRTVTWLTRNTPEVDVVALSLLERKHTGRGAIKTNPNAREVLYLVGHGTPTRIGDLDVYAVSEKLLQAGLTGERFASVVLCSCNTGDNRWVEGVQPVFAKTLARLLQVCVRAPPGLVRIDTDSSNRDGVDSGIQYTVAMPTADQKARYDAFVAQGKKKEADALRLTFPLYPFLKQLVDFMPDGAGYIPPLLH